MNARTGTERRIAYLIDKLVDQSCIVWDDKECEPETREHARTQFAPRALARLGYEAVPALITALDDDRPTREVSFLTTPSIKTVGDHALYILVKIACQYFDDDGLSYSERPDKEAVKERLQHWFSRAKAMGEQAMLLEGFRDSDSEKDWHFSQFVVRYPDSALRAFTEILPTFRSSHEISNFLGWIGDIPGEAATAVLAAAMKGVGRSCAVSILCHRREPNAIFPVIAEWNPDAKLLGEALEDRQDIGERLACSGKVPALAALARGVARVTPHERAGILKRLGSAFALNKIGVLQQQRRIRGGSLDRFEIIPDRLDREATKAAMIALLMAFLADTTQVPDRNYRLCDDAWQILNQIDPDRFPLGSDASLEEGDQRQPG